MLIEQISRLLKSPVGVGTLYANVMAQQRAPITVTRDTQQVQNYASPEQFQSELNDASVLCARNLAERSIGLRCIRIVEIHLIENVEHFRSKLKPQRFAKFEILQHAEIGAIERRTADQSTARATVVSSRQ